MLHKDFTVSEKQPYKPEVLQAPKFTGLLLVGAPGNEKPTEHSWGKIYYSLLCIKKKKKKQLYLVFLNNKQ